MRGLWRNQEGTMSERVILPGDRYKGPGGTIWRVVDPWLPIEERGELVGNVWIVSENDGCERWIESETFDNWVARGDFRSLRRQDDRPRRQRRRRDRGRAEVVGEARVRELQAPDGKTMIYRRGKTKAWLSGRGVDPEAVR